jgi:SAM-dependent methyltransferase
VIIKMYHRENDHAGSSPEFWDSSWSDGAFEEAVRFCEVDPLKPLFEKYVNTGDRLLEGGCGRGQYVVHCFQRGVDVVGFDFAAGALSNLHEHYPRIKVCAGDVSALPFSNGSFDVYFSGGVVEHFEGGSEVSLREAFRVLRPNGRLLISVPYLSPLRQAVALTRTRDWKWVRRPSADTPDGGHERNFYQYAFTKGEFQKLLERAGFEVVETRGYAVVWGLYDVPMAERLIAGLQRRRVNGLSSNGQPPAVGSGKPSQPSLLQRLVVSEDDTVPLAGIAVRAMRWACANMMMYACQKASGAG